MRPALLAALLALTSASATGQPRTGAWRAIGLAPDDVGFFGAVAATAVGPDGTLYAAGPFTEDGGATESGVARWDGEAWTGIGGPLASSVSYLAAGPGGVLYAAGRFDAVEGVPARRIAGWDGTSWHSLGSGLDGFVSSVAVGADGALVAVGSFAAAGGVPAAGLARWADGAWAALPPGGPAQPHSAVFATDGTLYVSGRTSAGENRVARLRNGVWDALPLLQEGADGPLVAGPGGTVYAVQWVGDSPGIAVWDGSAWTSLGAVPDAGGLCAYTVTADGAVYTYTYRSLNALNPPDCSRLSRYAAAAWALVDPFAYGIGSLVAGPAGVYAGGGFTELGERRAVSAALFSGDAWTALGDGLDPDGDVTGVAAAASGDVFVWGSFSVLGGVPARGVARWDGTAWHPLGAGLKQADGSAGGVTDAEVLPDGSLVVAGRFVQAGGAPAAGLARWNGTAWTALDPGDAAPTVLGVGPDGTLYGARTVGYNPVQSQVWHRSGEAWLPVGGLLTGSSSGSVLDLAVGPDGALYASGAVRAIGAVPAQSVVRWDGEAWEPVGSNAFNRVNGLAFHPDGRIVAAGGFYDQADRAVIVWDGQTWSPFGGPFDGTLISGGVTGSSAVTVGADGAVVVAGNFTTAGGAPASGLARWDGTAWAGYGDGTDSVPDGAATRPDGDVVVVGRFARAGGRPAPSVALFDAAAVAVEPTAAPTATTLSPAAPNPTPGRATLTLRLDVPEPVRVILVDALGRTVAVLFDGVPGEETTLVVETAGLPAGVYTVRVSGAAVAEARRLTVVR